jgi:hypothetical protein
MNLISDAVSKMMHLGGSSEEPTKETEPEEQPAEQPAPEQSQPEELKPEEAPQEQPVIEQAAGSRPTRLTPPAIEPAPEQPAIEPPPAEPSTPEAPKQQEPHPEQPTKFQIQKPKPPEGQPLPPNERVNAAYKLVYGENAEIPIQHESIITDQDADWHIRSYMGGLFATPNDHPLTQKFNNLEKLLEWFNETYPVQAGVE